MTIWRIRVVGCAMASALLWYASWIVANLNTAALWLSLLFVAANLLSMTYCMLALVNNWQRRVPAEQLVPTGAEPLVLVIVPTYGEPVWMVERTARSVVEQDWPAEKLVVVVSDDAHRAAIADVVVQLQKAYPGANIAYHEPARKGHPDRRGEAKAGNLNSAYEMAIKRYSDVPFVETRDADDEVGDPRFLRQCIGQLQVDDRTAFVQTVKEARVSRGDPFNNMESMFYRGLMLARNASNTVFPCGSGVVWRRTALDDIGGFPVWNLVEDLQSGVEALKRGWRGIYLPIVGAVAQHAPEDLPNVYKQRGTWAVDTVRLVLWGRLNGLNLRQWLQFIDLAFFYIQSGAPVLLMIVLIISLTWQISPVKAGGLDYSLHFWPFFLAMTAFLSSLAPRQTWRTFLRWHEMWIGLAPVYLKAAAIAVLYGPRRKPAYHVTRKLSIFGWYWREALAQMALLAVSIAALAFGVVHASRLSSFSLGSAGWMCLYIAILAGFVRKSWFGVRMDGGVAIATILHWTSDRLGSLGSRAAGPGGDAAAAGQKVRAPAD